MSSYRFFFLVMEPGICIIIKELLDNGREKVNQLHKVISNRNINLSTRRMLLLSVLRPSIEYGSEMWEGNKSQAGSWESIILVGAKRILGCSSKTCNEAVRGVRHIAEP